MNQRGCAAAVKEQTWRSCEDAVACWVSPGQRASLPGPDGVPGDAAAGAVQLRVRSLGARG